MAGLLLGGPAAGSCLSYTVQDAATGAAVTGIEDIAYLSGSQTVVISAYDRRANTPGGVYALSADEIAEPVDGPVDARPVVTDRDIEGDFRPHGFDVRALDNGLVQIAVLNRRHWGDGQRTTDLLFVETALDGTPPEIPVRVESTAFCAANDVAHYTEDSVFVTVDHGACRGFSRLLEDAFNLGRGRVLIVQPDGIREAASDLTFPNGVAYLASSETLVVAVTRDSRLQAYDLKALPLGPLPVLEPSWSLPVSMAPDNLSVSASGRLIAAGHDNLLSFAAFRAGLPWMQDPSSTVTIVDMAGDAQTANDVLTLTSPVLTGATAAVRFGDRIAAVGGYDDALAVCTLRGLPQ